MLDKVTKEAVLATIRRATMEANEVYQERWLTAEQLCAEVGLFSLDWLSRYGMMLPRECIRVSDGAGKCRRSKWCYPLHKILRMISEGALREIKVNNQ